MIFHDFPLQNVSHYQRVCLENPIFNNIRNWAILSAGEAASNCCFSAGPTFLGRRWTLKNHLFVLYNVIYIYVCMYVCMYVYIYIYEYAEHPYHYIAQKIHLSGFHPQELCVLWGCQELPAAGMTIIEDQCYLVVLSLMYLFICLCIYSYVYVLLCIYYVLLCIYSCFY